MGMPATRPTRELRRYAAALISERIEKIGVSAACKDLGVSRQAIYDIKKGKYCPSLAMVQRACEIWGLEFNFRGLRIGTGTLRVKTRRQAEQARPSLFDTIEEVQHRELEVLRAKRVGETIELVLRFRKSA